MTSRCIRRPALLAARAVDSACSSTFAIPRTRSACTPRPTRTCPSGTRRRSTTTPPRSCSATSGAGLGPAVSIDGQIRVGLERAVHDRGRQPAGLPQLLQDARCPDVVRELCRAQRLIDSDPRPRRDGPGVLSRRTDRLRLDGHQESERDRVLRSRPARHARRRCKRRLVVGVLVQRLRHRSIARGLDIFELLPSAHISQNRLDAAKSVRFTYLNVQGQQKLVWPATFALSRAYLDQLERNRGQTAERIAAARTALSDAEKLSGSARRVRCRHFRRGCTVRRTRPRMRRRRTSSRSRSAIWRSCRKTSRCHHERSEGSAFSHWVKSRSLASLVMTASDVILVVAKRPEDLLLRRSVVLRALEELNGPLVFLRGCPALERSEVSAFAGLRILLSRVEPVLAVFEFSNHRALRYGAERVACMDCSGTTRVSRRTRHALVAGRAGRVTLTVRFTRLALAANFEPALVP